jgi:hypothetical protein
MKHRYDILSVRMAKIFIPCRPRGTTRVGLFHAAFLESAP